MSLYGIFDPIVMAHFNGKSGGSSGGIGGVNFKYNVQMLPADFDPTTAESFTVDDITMYKVSDDFISVTELNNGVLLCGFIIEQLTEENCFGYTEGDTTITIDNGETTCFLSVNEEGMKALNEADMLGIPSPGTYMLGGLENVLFALFWHKAEVTL